MPPSASGAVVSVALIVDALPFAGSAAATSCVRLMNKRARPSVNLRQLAPAGPAGAQRVALPPPGLQDADGQLPDAALDAFCGTVRAAIAPLKRLATVKPHVARQYAATAGMVGAVLFRARLGTYFAERASGSGVWEVATRVHGRAGYRPARGAGSLRRVRGGQGDDAAARRGGGAERCGARVSCPRLGRSRPRALVPLNAHAPPTRLRLLLSAIIKGGCPEYRDREGTAKSLHGKGYGAVLGPHRGACGIGRNKDTPYTPGALRQHMSALAYVYSEAGVLDEKNPAKAKVVRDVLKIASVILGERRGPMPDTISPELALRIIGALNAGDVDQVRLAVMMVIMRTLGLRNSTGILLDTGDLEMTTQGLIVHSRYLKKSKLGVRTLGRE